MSAPVAMLGVNGQPLLDGNGRPIVVIGNPQGVNPEPVLPEGAQDVRFRRDAVQVADAQAHQGPSELPRMIPQELRDEDLLKNRLYRRLKDA